MTNVMMKTCLHQKIIKNSNLIQAMKSSLCPKPKVIRRPNFSGCRIYPNILPNVPKCGLNTRHDNREVTSREQTLHSDKCATGSIHTNGSMTINVIPYANCSAAQVYVLHPGQLIFAQNCRRRSFLQLLQSTER